MESCVGTNSLLYRLQCAYSFSQSTTEVFNMKKYGELCRDKQSFVSSTMYLLFFVVYNRGLQHEEVWRVVQGQTVFGIVYNVPTLFRSLQHRSLALSKHVTYYDPLSGFLHQNMIIPYKRAPLQIYDQCTPHSSSVGLMPGKLGRKLMQKNLFLILSLLIYHVMKL